MTLKEAILRINNESSWSVYAKSPFTADSEARIGQTQFENGGLLDDKEWVGNGDRINERASLDSFHDDFPNASEADREYAEEIWIEEGLIPELEAERREREAITTFMEGGHE